MTDSDGVPTMSVLAYGQKGLLFSQDDTDPLKLNGRDFFNVMQST